MPALDVDGSTVVDRLEDICWTREIDGRVVAQHVLTRVLYRRGPWADVLIAVREYQGRGRWYEGPSYHLTRWRWMGAAWRLQDRLRLRGPSMAALLGAMGEVQPAAEARVRELELVDELARRYHLTPGKHGARLERGSDGRLWLLGCVEGDQPLPREDEP